MHTNWITRVSALWKFVCTDNIFVFFSRATRPISTKLITKHAWLKFKFVQMKGYTFFQGEIITKLQKDIDEFKNSSVRTHGQFSIKLGTNYPWVKCILIYSNEGAPPVSKGTWLRYEIVKIHWKKKKSSSQEPVGQFQPNLAESILGWTVYKFNLWRATHFPKGR